MWTTFRRRRGAAVSVTVVLTAALLAPMAAATDTARPLGGDDSSEPLVGEVVRVAGTGQAGYSGDGLDAVDARINDRARISVGPDGTLYIADALNKQLRAVSPDGVIDTVPGTRAMRSKESDGPEVDGWFFSPSNKVQASAVGPDGALYLAADEDIRRVDESGEHTVIGGNGEASFDDGGDGGDGGPATEAWIYEPTGIDVDGDGNVYVADPNNHRVRKIDPEGTITTIVDGGDENGDLVGSLEGRLDVAVDSTGTVYVATDHVVQAVDPDGNVRTVIGDAEAGYAGDGGPVADASMGEDVGGIAVDDDDNLYIADASNNAVRRVDPDGAITTVGGGLDDNVADIVVGPEGNVYLAIGAEVRMLVRDGVEPDDVDEPEIEPAGDPDWADADPGTVVTVAGVEHVVDEDDVVATAQQGQDGEGGPRRIAVGDEGTVYYADPGRNQVGAVGADGTKRVVAGTGEEGFAGDGGPAEDAELRWPSGVATDADGSVYIADTGNSRVRRIDPDGDITTVAGSELPDDDEEIDLGDGGSATEAGLQWPTDVAVDADGSLYIADITSRRIRQVGPDGTITTIAGGGERWKDEADNAPATQASLWEPGSIDVDSAGNVYFLENAQPAVRMIRPDGTLVTVAGNSYLDEEEGGFAGDGADAVDAELNTPRDVAVGPDDAVYVADAYNGRIRRIDQDGVIDTVAGNGQRTDDGDDGPAVDAAVDEPASVAVTDNGGLHMSSLRSGNIRTVDESGTIATLADLSNDEPVDDAAIEVGAERDATDVTLDLAQAQLEAGPGGQLYVRGRSGELDVISESTIRREDTATISVATAPDGSYVAARDGNRIHRVYPDGREIVIAGGGPLEEPAEQGQVGTALDLTGTNVTVDAEGKIYVVVDEGRLLRLEPDGIVDGIVSTDKVGEAQITGLNRLAPGPDGELYAAQDSRVVRVESDGDTASVAGTGDTTVYDDDIGDGGDATEATMRGASDVAVAGDGTLYVSTMDGVRRVDTDGDIMTVYESPTESDGTTTSYSPPGALAVDERGDVYFVDSSTNQIRVIVQPGEVSEPFPWGWAALIGGLVVAAAGAVLGYLRRHQLAKMIRRRGAGANDGGDYGAGYAAT